MDRVPVASIVSTGLMMMPTSMSPPSRSSAAAAKECIHSGHFMVSNVDIDAENVDDVNLNVPLLVEDSPDASDVKVVVDPCPHSCSLPTGATHQLTIDDSLTKLFNTLTIAYKQQISNPRWNMFKGMRLNMKDKIRLNNVIWRCWHIQFVRRGVLGVCRFASPSDDDKHIPPAVVLEGKYWKRKPEAVSAEYKKWRTYSKQRLYQMRSGDSAETRRALWPSADSCAAGESGPQSETGDLMDFSNDTLMELLMQQSYAFPNPREIARLGVADLIQPGLVQLQPNFDCGFDLMDTMEPLDGWIGSRLPTLEEEPATAPVAIPPQQPSLITDTAAEQCLSLMPSDAVFSNLPVQYSSETDSQLIVPHTDSPIHSYSPSPPTQPPPSRPVTILPDSFALAPSQSNVQSGSAIVVGPPFTRPSEVIGGRSVAASDEVFLVPPDSAGSATVFLGPSVAPASDKLFVGPQAPAATETVFVAPSSPRRVVGTHATGGPSMRRSRASHSLSSAPALSRTPMKNATAFKTFVSPTPVAPLSVSSSLQRRRSLTDVQMARASGAMVRSFSDSSGATAAAIRSVAARPIACAHPVSVHTTPAPTRPLMLTQLLESPSSAAACALAPSIPAVAAPPPPSGLVASPPSSSYRRANRQRRPGHSSSEQRRRGSIKGGFDQLYRLIPTLHLSSASKLSKAALLHKGADFIHQMRSDCSRLQEDISSLRSNIESINHEISDFQAMLPASGAPVTRVRQHRLREMLDDYVRERTLSNWRFFVFSQLLPALLDSYAGSVSGGAGGEELLRSVLAWQQQYCSLTQLRPCVTAALCQLSRSTSALTQPALLPQEAINAICHQPRQPVTTSPTARAPSPTPSLNDAENVSLWPCSNPYRH